MLLEISLPQSLRINNSTAFTAMRVGRNDQNLMKDIFASSRCCVEIKLSKYALSGMIVRLTILQRSQTVPRKDFRRFTT